MGKSYLFEVGAAQTDTARALQTRRRSARRAARRLVRKVRQGGLRLRRAFVRRMRKVGTK